MLLTQWSTEGQRQHPPQIPVSLQSQPRQGEMGDKFIRPSEKKPKLSAKEKALKRPSRMLRDKPSCRVKTSFILLFLQQQIPSSLQTMKPDLTSSGGPSFRLWLCHVRTFSSSLEGCVCTQMTYSRPVISALITSSEGPSLTTPS